MFRDRDNLVGLGFLIVMGALAAILIRAIVTGERITLDLSPAVSAILALVFFALIFVALRRSGVFGRFFGDRRGRQWPDPQTGGKSLWDRIRGR